MTITEHIVDKTGIPLLDEPSNNKYKMFNTGGVESEIGEFLYALVRMIKPTSILETGTHFGISSTYMALGLKHNNHGKIITIDPIYWDEAKKIHKDLDILSYLEPVTLHAENYETTEMFDIAFLDTEPSLRFNEFEKFYNNVNPGGLIIIHDLHPHLSYGCVNLDHPEFKHWPYGDFREKLGIYIKSHQVQTFSFSTPRGITIFQKSKPVMSYLDLINGVI